MAYQSIDGIQYEKELLDLAKKHTTGRGEGRISKDEVADLFTSATDTGQGAGHFRQLAFLDQSG